MLIRRLLFILSLVMVPSLVMAQGVPETIRSLHSELDTLLEDMLTMSDGLLAASRAIAGFGAVFYIGYRVWKHIANAEAIDFFPLVRPFVLAWCIAFFPYVIAVMLGVLSPTTAATQAMYDDSNKTVETLLAQRQKEMRESKSYKMYGVNDGQGDRSVWMSYTHPNDVGDEGIFGGIGNDIEFAMERAYYNIKNMFKDLLSFLLQILYETAALCINTLRTFHLLICSLLGPFVFAIAVFDGFQHSLTVWIAKFVNFYLWLPVANILGSLLAKIQQKMIVVDIDQYQTYGDTFFTTSDVGYIAFMLIGIVCYFTVPSMASLIVNAGGSALTSKVTSMTVGGVGGLGSAAAGSMGMGADMLGNDARNMGQGRGVDNGINDYFRDRFRG